MHKGFSVIKDKNLLIFQVSLKIILLKKNPTRTQIMLHYIIKSEFIY